MPLSLDAMLVQPAASGSFTAISGSATLGNGTTAGNTVLLVVGSRNAIGTTPSGFVNTDTPGIQSSGQLRTYVFRRSNAPAGETSWTITQGATGIITWIAFELVGLDPTAPLDVVPSATVATTSGTSPSAGTTPRSTTYDGLVLAAWAAWNAGSTTAPTFSGHTGGLAELAEVGGNDGTNSIGLSVAAVPTQQLATYTSTATSSITLTATNSANALILVYSAEGAKREPNVAFFWSFFPGVSSTPAGLGTGVTGWRYFETVTGSPAITADGLQLTGAAAAQNVTGAANELTIPSTASNPGHLARIRFRLDSLSGDLDLATLVDVGTKNTVIRYVSASQKLGVKVGAGAEQVSDATVTTGQWYDLDIRTRGTSTSRTTDWQVNYGSGWVTQTQATDSFAGPTPLGSPTPRLGWTAASTGTVTYAYAVYSLVAGHYPLGDFTFALLTPSGTPTVSGTVGNFAFITNNATGAALTSGTLVNVPATIDDFPPTVGASADGVCAITGSGTDYLEIPMGTSSVSGTASIRAARVVVPMWAAAATVATCRVLGFDGTTATTLFFEADPAADNTTTPAWICIMWRPTGGWDQAKLDAAAIRFGATDATPDIGPHAIGMEVAIQNADIHQQFGDLVALSRDPVTDGILAVAVTPTLGYDAILHYEEGGTPTDVPTPGGATTTEVIDAPDAPSVNYVALYPPAEDISDA